MSMRMRAILFGALGVALIGAGFWWFLSNYHQVPFDLRTPPSAAARRNRLLALEETLRARGHQVFNQLRFDSKHFGDPGASAVVLDLDPRALRASDVDALLEFVSDGALLLLRMPGSADGRAGALLDRLGINPIEEDEAHCFTIKIKHTKDYRMCAGTPFGGDDVETSYTRLASFDDEEYGYWYGESAFASGRIFVVSELSMLHNGALDQAESVQLGHALLTPLLARTRIHLFRGFDGEPFHVMIVRRGWPLLLPAAIALLLWLWMRSQRFGPLLPNRSPRRRALLEHVRASGEFLFRRGQPVALHRALLARVHKRLAEREPLLAALPEPERNAALAARCKVSVAAIEHALNPVGLGRADHFFSALSTLLQLERHL